MRVVRVFAVTAGELPHVAFCLQHGLSPQKTGVQHHARCINFTPVSHKQEYNRSRLVTWHWNAFASHAFNLSQYDRTERS